MFEARLRLRARKPVRVPPHGAANLIRGQFGKELFHERPELYRTLFSPERREEGPSGFQDRPRPYVLRTRHLDGREFREGDWLEFGVNVFDATLAGELGVPVVRRELDLAEAQVAGKVRVRFLTPTELKGAEQPEFGVLLARLRDRCGALAAFYQEGELDLDFKGLGERARKVRMTRCAVEDVDRARKSGRTGQVHAIGGYVGEAEYEGEIGEFVSFLRAGAWTGVGRQTVWGKGEIAFELLG